MAPQQRLSADFAMAEEPVMDLDLSWFSREYTDEEIHWFLVNYWQNTREGLIEAFKLRFADEHFDDLSYEWLEFVYGQDPEWG